MTVRVRYFASLVDRTGVAVETVEIEAGSDVEALWAELVRRHPALGELRTRPLVACDLEFGEWSRTLDGTDEVGFLPPVSGG